MSIDLSFNETQEMLRSTARDLFERHAPLTKWRDRKGGPDFSRELWAQMAKLGWLGMRAPEDQGGLGCSLVDLYALYLEMGRKLVDTPHLETAVIAVDLLAELGDPAALLADIADGKTVVIPAFFGADGGFRAQDVTLVASGSSQDVHLKGTVSHVRFAADADYLLLAAQENSGLSLFLARADAPGISVTPQPNIARTALSRLDLDLAGKALVRLGKAGAAGETFDRIMGNAAVLVSAEVAGAGESILGMSVDYARNRVQFGVPIGKYQAVQYLCTDILHHYRHTSLLALHAASREDEPDFLLRASMAKAQACLAAPAMTFAAHEVHAGIAFIEDYDLQLYTRRAKLWENSYGDRRAHLDAIAGLW